MPVKQFIIAVILSCCFFPAWAQSDDFCEAVMAITKDGRNKFKNTRGNVIGSNVNATMWQCGIKVPGTINARFVQSMGLFYEGAFFQSKDKKALREAYERYKIRLKDCLGLHGYAMTELPNFFPGLADFKKLTFMVEPDENVRADNAPAHLTLEATYNKDVGFYTLVLYIFEH